MATMASRTLRSLRRTHHVIGRTPAHCASSRKAHQMPAFWKGSRRYTQWDSLVVNTATKRRLIHIRTYNSRSKMTSTMTLASSEKGEPPFKKNTSASPFTRDWVPEETESILQYGPLGRPIMTETSLKQLLIGSDEGKTRLSKLENLVQLSGNDLRQAVFQTTSPKSLWNQTRDKLGLELPQYRHEVLPGSLKQHKVTLLTVMANPTSASGTTNFCYKALRVHDHVGSHPEFDWIELVAVGIASTKQRASQMAALDQIQLWKEATGIDLTLPPELRPLDAFSDKGGIIATTSIHDNDGKQLYSQSQTLLGLLRCSPIRYDFDFVQGSKTSNSYWTAEAETYWEGNYYFSTTNTDNEGSLIQASSKKEAKKHALVALLEQNKDTSLGMAADSYRPLLESAPRIAALRIPRWKENIVMKQLAASLETWERLIVDSKYDISISHSKRQNNPEEKQNSERIDQPINILASDSTSIALWNREQTKLQRYSKGYPNIFQTIQKTRENLPIATLRNDLNEALKTSNVILVQAGTGSGKSTQIPQYILEDSLSSKTASTTRVIVTQPRRIAAKSLAERVAHERLEIPPTGGSDRGNSNSKNRSVGYSVRFDSLKPREEGGTIEYVTTGILLKRLISGDKELEGISHVLIDEVHERDLNTDLLLILMRDLLVRRQQQSQRGLQSQIPKLVLLSATLDTSALSKYFAPTTLNGENSIPVVSLPTKPLHPVKTWFLEDIIDSNNKDGKGFPPELQQLASSLLQSNDHVLKQELNNLNNNHDEKAENADRIAILQKVVSLREDKGTKPLTPDAFRTTIIGLVSELVLHLSQIEIAKNKTSKSGGSILCFLPGMSEIKECMYRLQEDCPKTLEDRLIVLPLHSDIPQHEQAKVFKPSKSGTVKVILSTNIAESSLTIDDTLTVIDSGLVKDSVFDAASSVKTLETIMVSRKSSTQRLGRVGRVAPGSCYRLYSEGDFKAMQEKATPEILKSCLGRACLQVCSLLEENNTQAFRSVRDFLGSAMDAPPDDSVNAALEELTMLGAISKTEKLTSLGECLVRLPLDPSIGKMLVTGAAMNCLSPLLTAAAWFGESQIVFSTPSLTQTRNSLRSFSVTSDIEGIICAYDKFWQVRTQEGWKAAKLWARENGVNLAAMTSMRAVRRQLLDELCKVGLVKEGDVVRGELRMDASVNQHDDCKLLVSALCCTAVPQNLAARNRISGFGVLATASEESARLHPSSVLFHRRPPSNDVDDETLVLPEWYSFHRKVQTSSVFLRGCSSILPEQILLFGGSHLDISATTTSSACSQGRRIKGILDGWIAIDGVNEENVDFLIRARNAIETILERKLLNLSVDPKKYCTENDNLVIDGLRRFLDELDTGRIPELDPRAPSNDFLDYFLEDGEAECK